MTPTAAASLVLYSSSAALALLERRPLNKGLPLVDVPGDRSSDRFLYFAKSTKCERFASEARCAHTLPLLFLKWQNVGDTRQR